MGKQKGKPQLLKITLTAIWKGETVTETISSCMGLACAISDKNRKAMIDEMKQKYKELHYAERALHPGMKLTVKAQVKSWEVDYILN